MTEKANAALRRIMKESPSILPASWETLFPQIYHDRIEVCVFTGCSSSYSNVQKLLDSSFTGGSVEVREIRTMSNSVRWLNVPSRPQFGVFAMQDLPKGYPILCYKVFCCLRFWFGADSK